MDVLFAEELGWLLEIEQTNQDAVLKLFSESQVTCNVIGYSQGQGHTAKVNI